jgi:hypothetical protein
MKIKNKVPFSDIKIKKYKSLNDLEKLQEDKNIISINDIESQVEIGISNTTNNKEKYVVTQDNRTYFVSCKANINMKIIWTLIFILIIILIITVSNQ